MDKLLLKSGLIIGLMAGFFLVLLFFTLFSIGTSFTSLMYDVDLGLIIFFIFISLIYFRDYKNYQEMKFTQGLITGGVSTVVSSSIVAMFIIVFLTYIYPEALHEDVKRSVGELMNINKKGENIYISLYGQKEFDLQIEAFKTVTVGQLAIKKFLSISIVGFIFTLVLSIFLRKKHDTNA